MPDLLIYADAVRDADMRHELPAPLHDPFLFMEHDGARSVVLPSVEAPLLADVPQAPRVLTWEELGFDRLIASGAPRHRVLLELASGACRLLGVRSASVPPTFPLELADHLRAADVILAVDRDAFAARRRVKTPAELAGVRRAQHAADAAMAAVRDGLARAEPGTGGLLRLDGRPLTTEVLRDAARAAAEAHGATIDECIVSHGPQSAVGHEPGSGEIHAEEPVLVDLWPRDRASGCYADMTRTFVVGTPPAWLVEDHALCREALARAVGRVRPGVVGSDVHRDVDAFFAGHGRRTRLTKAEGEVLEDGFLYSLGHGVGLEVHEEPGLGLTPGAPLVTGDVLALEPALVRAGLGGCRVEDLVLVTPDGCEVLTDFPYALAPVTP